MPHDNDSADNRLFTPPTVTLDRARRARLHSIRRATVADHCFLGNEFKWGRGLNDYEMPPSFPAPTNDCKGPHGSWVPM